MPDVIAFGEMKVWNPDLKLLVVTRGPAGCRYATLRFTGAVPGFGVTAIATTGAGDAFVAALLNGLLEHPHALEDEAQTQELCRFSNAAGALATTQRGAITVLLTAQQVAAFLNAHQP